ncbi:DUF397 domain-containing protein [Actinomadura sp. PM05-2]|uniref:DUF397 domain-containing protein n=1 Tax=Actinomadura parmotrematis TaxID=2864039 RepID=A0ABS7G4N8_9ACTN|nr:DUF397 domain-containing protein [Actinomadura parmotrematis]
MPFVAQADVPREGTSSSPNWRKSARCGSNTTCVEVAALSPGSIGTRDTKQGTTGPILRFSATAWNAFVQRTKEGAYDMSADL